MNCKIAQRQGALCPNDFHKTFSTRNSLFKTAGAEYCMYKLRHKAMLAFGSSYSISFSKTLIMVVLRNYRIVFAMSLIGPCKTQNGNIWDISTIRGTAAPLFSQVT